MMKKYEEERNSIINDVVHLGSLHVNGIEKPNFKVDTQKFYLENKPNNERFADYLHSKYGWHSVSIFDDNTSFKPFDFHYNDAGLQYKVLDENKNIKLECLNWTLVAKITAKQIKNNEYVAKPSILKTLNSFGNKYPNEKEITKKSNLER